MALFKFIGEAETIFHNLIAPGGSTVTAQPGEEFEVEGVTNPTALAHPDLEPVDNAARQMAEAASTTARLDAVRVYGETAEPADEEEAPAAAEAAPAAPEAPAAPAPAPAEEAPADEDTAKS